MTVSEEMFGNWMGVFETRLGKPLDDFAYRAYYTALRNAFADDDEFHRAAQRVFEKHEWNTWPAPIEFESAAASNRRIPDAEIRETYRRIIAPAEVRLLGSGGPPRALADFAGPDGWRAELTRAGADPDALTRERRAGGRHATPDDGWLTDERRPPEPDADAERDASAA